MTELVSFSIRRSRLRWFGHAEHKDDRFRLGQVMCVEKDCGNSSEVRGRQRKTVGFCQGGYGELPVWPVLQ